MSGNLYIEHYCRIANSSLIVDGLEVTQDDNLNLNQFLKLIYTQFDISYPKYFKMDKLCKLAFIAAEMVLKSSENLSNCGIVFSNNASSLDTDRKHQSSIENQEQYYPSPSIFVYTLPNIAIGEICIKHKIFGENAFFVKDQYDASFHYAYESSLLATQKSNKILGGWVNVDGESYEAFLYLISDRGNIPYQIETLEKLYSN